MLSVREVAGLPWYSAWQSGQIIIGFSFVFIFIPPFADIQGIFKEFQTESEIGIADSTRADVRGGRNADFSVFVHDVHKSLDFPAFYGDFHFRFVVEIRTALLNVGHCYI